MQITNRRDQFDTRHGGPYDRGGADAYYRRRFNPHYYVGNTHSSERVVIEPNTPEWEAYKAGWEDCDDFKDWG